MQNLGAQRGIQMGKGWLLAISEKAPQLQLSAKGGKLKNHAGDKAICRLNPSRNQGGSEKFKTLINLT